MATREQVLAALAARLQTKVPSLKVLRAYRDPNSLGPEEQPAAFVLADTFTPQESRGRPPVWVLRVDIVLYARAQEASETPETQINALIDAVEVALQRSDVESITDMTSPYTTNLGGLCSRCWISGSVDLIPGEPGGQAAALIPVEILLP